MTPVPGRLEPRLTDRSARRISWATWNSMRERTAAAAASSSVSPEPFSEAGVEAVASSLTEMFAPAIISERVSGMLRNYDFVSESTLAYFKPRLTQAPQDVDFALRYVKQHADTREKQELCLAALRFKCDLLWAQLDALHHAYVAPGLPPPGAFVPEGFAPGPGGRPAARSRWRRAWSPG